MHVGLRQTLGIFSGLFAAGMWMSKIAQPLYFESAGALVSFGVGYAVMALAGGLSFAWGAIADRIGGLNAVRIGTTLYAIGIAGRLLTDIAPSIIFSAVAGIGASLALVGIRPWVRSESSPENIPRVVSSRNLGNQIGVFAGGLLAASVFALAGQSDSGPRWVLSLAPVVVLAGVAWLFVVGRTRPSAAGQPRQDSESHSKREFVVLAAKLAFIGVLSGFYVSLVTPYVPLFLTAGGLTDSAAALSIAVMSLTQVVVTWVISRRSIGERPIGLFFVAELVTGLMTLAVAYAAGLPSALLIALFVARAAFVAIAVTAEETIQYAVIPGNAAGLIFGISQTAFLVGDSLGGAIGAPLWAMVGPAGLALVAGIVTVINALLFPLLMRAARPREAMT